MLYENSFSKVETEMLSTHRNRFWDHAWGSQRKCDKSSEASFSSRSRCASSDRALNPSCEALRKLRNLHMENSIEIASIDERRLCRKQIIELQLFQNTRERRTSRACRPASATLLAVRSFDCTTILTSDGSKLISMCMRTFQPARRPYNISQTEVLTQRYS